MNIKEELLAEHSKKLTLKLTSYIGNDKKRFAELMACVFSKDKMLTARAAWVMSYCALKNHTLIDGYLPRMIKNMQGDVHVAVKRNTVRVLQHIEIPKELRGMAATTCFDLLQSATEPVAVKCFSMTVLANICKHEPELASELKLIIEDQLSFASAGFKARARKITGFI